MKIILPLSLILLSAGPIRAEPATRCLPMEAGQRLSSLVDSGGIQDALPADTPWKLESANIEVSRLVLTFQADSQTHLGVILSADGPGETRGRWFAYTYFNNQGPPTEDQIRKLAETANRIDQAFESSPWVACLEDTGNQTDFSNGSLPKPRGSEDPAGLLFPLPAWIFLSLGLVQLLLLVLGLASALWNRTPPPTRSRP